MFNRKRGRALPQQNPESLGFLWARHNRHGTTAFQPRFGAASSEMTDSLRNATQPRLNQVLRPAQSCPAQRGELPSPCGLSHPRQFWQPGGSEDNTDGLPRNVSITVGPRRSHFHPRHSVWGSDHIHQLPASKCHWFQQGSVLKPSPVSPRRGFGTWCPEGPQKPPWGWP